MSFKRPSLLKFLLPRQKRRPAMCRPCEKEEKQSTINEVLSASSEKAVPLARRCAVTSEGRCSPGFRPPLMNTTIRSGRRAIDSTGSTKLRLPLIMRESRRLALHLIDYRLLPKTSKGALQKYGGAALAREIHIVTH